MLDVLVSRDPVKPAAKRGAGFLRSEGRLAHAVFRCAAPVLEVSCPLRAVVGTEASDAVRDTTLSEERAGLAGKPEHRLLEAATESTPRAFDVNKPVGAVLFAEEGDALFLLPERWLSRTPVGVLALFLHHPRTLPRCLCDGHIRSVEGPESFHPPLQHPFRRSRLVRREGFVRDRMSQTRPVLLEDGPGVRSLHEAPCLSLPRAVIPLSIALPRARVPLIMIRSIRGSLSHLLSLFLMRSGRLFRKLTFQLIIRKLTLRKLTLLRSRRLALHGSA
mmetsp:Transcript_574/g.1281  ORF Transcript_574/g.1281 Transcript_574/m.1281 type:complete len:276 (+) Transcript_574:232-1059(+)